jgi:hypothetical protein
MLTTISLRSISVPIVFVLECVIIMVLLINLQTNRDIDNSPARNRYSRRDRVWEPRDQLQVYNVNCNSFSNPRGDSLRRRHKRCAVARIFSIAKAWTDP